MSLSTTYTKTETDFLIQQLEMKTSSGYQGDLLKTDAAPTTKGFYALLETGVYTNLGGIEALSNKLNFASFDGTTWQLISIDIPNYSVNTTLNPTDNTKGSTDKAVADYIDANAVKDYYYNSFKELAVFKPSTSELNDSYSNLTQKSHGFLIPKKNLILNRFQTYLTGETGYLDIKISIYDVDASVPSSITLGTPIYQITKTGASAANPVTEVILPDDIYIKGYLFIKIENADPTKSVVARRKNNIPVPTDGLFSYGYFNTTDGSSNVLTKNSAEYRLIAPVLFWDSKFVKKEAGKGLSSNDYISADKALVDKLKIENINTWNPSSAEYKGSTNVSYFGAGVLFQNKNLSFNKITHNIIGESAFDTIIMNIYELDNILTGSGLNFSSPIHTQKFVATNNNVYTNEVYLTKTITAVNKYILITFTNETTSKKVNALSFNNVAVPGDGIYCIPYFQAAIGGTWAKNSDTYRFASPILSLSNNILPEKNILNDRRFQIVNDLRGESHLQNVELVKGAYGAENSRYKFKTIGNSLDAAYFGVEFKMNDNVHLNNGEKEILNITKENGDFVKLIIKTDLPTQFSTKQILFEKPSSSESYWNFNSIYPLPFYNCQFIVKTQINGVVKDLTWVKRNPREWKPLVGADAFSLQFKPQVIKNGGKIYDNQALYEANKNWYMDILSDRFVLRNSDLGKNIEFLYSTYPKVNQLFSKIESETALGGLLEDFQFEQLSTGVISNTSVSSRNCTDLLQCTLKLVDKYPYKGTNAKAEKTAYDCWRAVVPYWQDETWHSFELAYNNSNKNFVVTIDGKSDGTLGQVLNTNFILSSATVNLGIEGGLNSTFKDLEFYNGSTNGYTIWQGNLAKTYIASKKNPRIVGIMWHDVLNSNVVSRPTTWADVPKNQRAPFATLVNSTWVGGKVIYYRDYGQFTSTPTLISGNIYEVNTVDGLRIRGNGLTDGSGVYQITATEILSGTWTTSTMTKHYEGLIIRVGDDVLQSTAFLEQCFETARKNNYKLIKWRDVINVLNGQNKFGTKMWSPQFDDYALYLFTDAKIYSLFKRWGHTISVAWDMAFGVDENGVIDDNAKEITNQMRVFGEETVIHNHWKYPTMFVSDILSDEAEIAIKECMAYAKKFGTEATIWDESANLSTPNSQKLMEILGIELCISTQNDNTTRATHRMYASRTSLNPLNAVSPVIN